ncbi:MAG: 50S ribosomal protein L9 [Planctomycetes bacterium]|nr:50S ribosomal protein L9 [Planctomycetota bacterium]
MKVLLHADIDGVGFLGDVVEVSDGYGRNYLLPQKMAVRPTEDNIKQIQKDRAQQAEARRMARERLVAVAKSVNESEVTLEALANEQGHLFGSIGEEDVAQALRDKGFEIKTKYLQMPEHFRKVDTYEVALKFDSDIEAQIQVHVVSPKKEQEDDSEPGADDE